MERAEVIRLNEGEHINVDLVDLGYRINGPAIVVVIKEETAHEAEYLRLMQQEQRVAKKMEEAEQHYTNPYFKLGTEDELKQQQYCVKES